MNLSKEKYHALVSDVEREFGLLLAKSEESEESKEEESKEHEDKGDDHEVKNAITGEPEHESEDKISQDKEETAEDKKDEKEHAEAKENEAAHGYDEGDMEELHKIYGSMSAPEIKLHKSICDHHHLAKCGQMSQPEIPMGKSETSQVEVKKTLSKSEADVLKDENEALKKSVKELLTAVESFVVAKAPARKAITEIGVLGKTESVVSKQLNKSEITVILDSKTKDPSLSKSDRDVINNYYSGKCSVEQIKHLLGN